MALPLHAKAADTKLQPLRALLRMAPGSIDYGDAKLTIDRMVAPAYDYDLARRSIDGLLYSAQRLIATVPVPLSPYHQKVEALRAVIYAPGAWNGYRPFRYDLESDPTGTRNPKGPLLPNYLETRLGNCVSMPALFLALAQRIGLTAHLTVSPEHTFVKTRQPDGTYVNHECTHEAGLKADASYVREHEITPLAVRCKTYLQPLTPRQAVVTMARTLVAHQCATGDSLSAHAAADLLLEVEPTFFPSMYSKLLAYASMQQRFSKYRNLAEMPPDQRTELLALMQKMDEWEGKVRAIGWVPPLYPMQATNVRATGGEIESKGKSR